MRYKHISITHQAGFTLVELMVAMMIIAVLAAIAVPSYRAQVRMNGEEQARQRIQAIAIELANWRSKQLTYSGFIPKNDGCGSNSNNPVVHCYSKAGGIVYVPLGSDEDTYEYEITISTNSTGSSWQMMAKPNTDHNIFATADTYYMDSLGNKREYSHSVGNTLTFNGNAPPSDNRYEAW